MRLVWLTLIVVMVPRALPFCPAVPGPRPPRAVAAQSLPRSSWVILSITKPRGFLAHQRAHEVGDTGDTSRVPLHRRVVRKAAQSNHSADRTDGALGAGLPDLRKVRDVERLLDVMGQFVVDNTHWRLTAQDAAVSLHLLHRAGRNGQAGAAYTVRRSSYTVRRRQAGQSDEIAEQATAAQAGNTTAAQGISKETNRQEKITVVLAAAVAQGIRRSALEPKYLSMALTALADRARRAYKDEAYKEVFHLASECIQGMTRKASFGQLPLHHVAGTEEVVKGNTNSFTAQTISMLATAFVKSEIVDDKFFAALTLVLKQTMPPDRLSARQLGMVLKSFARANALTKDAQLVSVLCSQLVMVPLEDFDAQSCTDVVFALARIAQQGLVRGWEGDERDQALQHMVDAFLLLPDEQLVGGGDAGHAALMLAALSSALASVRVTDKRVFQKLSMAVQRMDRGQQSAQTIATIMHAFASAGQCDKELVQALTDQLLRIPLRSVQARAAANIAWCAAVEESMDPALLCWIWRSLDSLMPSMQADGLSQVHQFLLHAQLSNFTREDVFTAFYGQRSAPASVRQTFNALEESAEERCRREFIHESLLHRIAQRSSRLHEKVSSVLLEVAPTIIPDLRPATQSEEGEHNDWLQQEYVDHLSGYSMDMLIPSYAIAIEVDGSLPLSLAPTFCSF